LVETVTTYNAPFDSVASVYDKEYGETFLMEHIRPVIWKSLFSYFHPGDHILELNAGTCTDAIKLAEHDIRVTATDASDAMLEIGRRKIAENNLSAKIDTQQVSLENLQVLSKDGHKYDGIFSNFGGLNCAPDLSEVVRDSSELVKPGGILIFCIINKLCIWEVLSYLLRGKPAQAFRRMKNGGVDAHIGDTFVHVRYYTLGDVKKMLSPWYKVEDVYGVSILSPPPNSGTFSASHQSLVLNLLGLDDTIRRTFPFYLLADHFVVVAKRTA